MASPEEPETQKNESGRLNGWKEIAAYLGKSVRSVQRWEVELRLPVRRLGRDGGEIVFAFKSEVDAWSRNDQLKEPAGEEPVVIAAPVAIAPPAPAPAGRSAWGLWPVVTAVTVVLVGLVWSRPKPEEPLREQPSRVTVEATHFTAFGPSGGQVWTWPAPEAVDPELFKGGDPTQGTAMVVLRDLEGDGEVETIIQLRTIGRTPANGLYVLDSRGKQRFAYTPTDSKQFGQKVYAGPWLPYRLYIFKGPSNSLSLRVVLTHGTDHPTMLTELDAQGRELSKYWSDGYIESVAEGNLNGHAVILVGGTNNETRGASLAVLPAHGFSGHFPSADEAYRCNNCGSREPLLAAVFPRRCVAQEMGQQAMVANAWIDGASHLHALVREGKVHGGLWTELWYDLSADTSSISVDIPPGYKDGHDRLQAAGWIKHSYDQPTALFPVLTWSGAKWIELTQAQ